MDKPRYYVYVLKTVEGRVFYVGKGSRQRMFWHRHVLERPHLKEYNRGVYTRMRAILGSSAFIEEKVFESDDELDALRHEHGLICYYGFENLVNTQSHAFAGRKLKPEVGRLISKRLTGRKLSTEHRAKISAGNVGRIVTPETAIKRLRAWKSNPANAAKARQQAIKMCASHAGKPRSAEYRAKLSALHLGKPVTWGDAISAGLAGKASRRAAKSKYRGVTWFKPKKAWQSRICVDRKTRLLGQFKLEIDAAWAFDNAFEAQFGTRPNATDSTHQPTRFKRGQRGVLVALV